MARISPAQFAKKWLAPMLAEYGLEPHGKALGLHSPTGPWLIMGVQASSASSRAAAEFYVSFAIIPDPWIEYTREAPILPSEHPLTLEEGMINGRVRDDGRDRWAVTSDNVEATATRLRGKLAQVMPSLLELTDQKILKARLDTDPDSIPGVFSLLAAKIVVRVDDGLTDELIALLDQLEERSRFSDWAYARALAAVQRST